MIRETLNWHDKYQVPFKKQIDLQIEIRQVTIIPDNYNFVYKSVNFNYLPGDAYFSDQPVLIIIII